MIRMPIHSILFIVTKQFYGFQQDAEHNINLQIGKNILKILKKQIDVMENLKVGDVVNINIAKGLQIVIIHIKSNNFQGVYFNSLTQELNITPMLPLKIAIKIEQVND